MVKGLTFYKGNGAIGLENSDATIQFTQKLNDVFDCLNRKYIAEAIRKGSNDLNVSFFYFLCLVLICLVFVGYC